MLNHGVSGSLKVRWQQRNELRSGVLAIRLGLEHKISDAFLKEAKSNTAETFTVVPGHRSAGTIPEFVEEMGFHSILGTFARLLDLIRHQSTQQMIYIVAFRQRIVPSVYKWSFKLRPLPT